uniref:Uncharacterized protein n=1 Tax=Aliarcobacter butzleri TaxID=28197 RepID=W0M006_9BACT|nr:hypothetical protein [Aliarcobacter butzleri]
MITIIKNSIITMIKMDFKNLTSFHEVEFLPEVAAFGKTS